MHQKADSLIHETVSLVVQASVMVIVAVMTVVRIEHRQPYLILNVSTVLFSILPSSVSHHH